MGDSGMVRPLSAIGCRLSAIGYPLSAIGYRQRKPYNRACDAMETHPLLVPAAPPSPPLKRGTMRGGEKDLTPQACP